MKKLFVLAIGAVIVTALASGFTAQKALAQGTQLYCQGGYECEPVCTCVQRTTATFRRVGSTCDRAKENAAQAAMDAAVCASGEWPCGQTQVFVSYECEPHPVSGAISALAFANYYCQVCQLQCHCIDP